MDHSDDDFSMDSNAFTVGADNEQDAAVNNEQDAAVNNERDVPADRDQEFSADDEDSDLDQNEQDLSDYSRVMYPESLLPIYNLSLNGTLRSYRESARGVNLAETVVDIMENEVIVYGTFSCNHVKM